MKNKQKSLKEEFMEYPFPKQLKIKIMGMMGVEGIDLTFSVSKAINELVDTELLPLFEKEKKKAYAEAEKKSDERMDEYIAYCDCGDALERKELYPNEATYYCFGCDKTYRLILVYSEKN